MQPELMTHRNLLDSARVEEFLGALPVRASPLSQVLARGGLALTVDDASRAAGEAARLARRLGHEVTIFVNPDNVQSVRPHYFFLLNAALEQAPYARLGSWDLRSPAGRRDIRKQLKQEFLRLDTEEDRMEWVRAVAARLEVEEPDLPDHLVTLGVDELEDLVSAGVQLGNHGWQHADPRHQDVSSVELLVERGATWLQETFGVSEGVFAVPFGKALPPRGLDLGQVRWWLLSDARLHPGFVGPGLYNRMELLASDDQLAEIEGWLR